MNLNNPHLHHGPSDRPAKIVTYAADKLFSALDSEIIKVLADCVRDANKVTNLQKFLRGKNPGKTDAEFRRPPYNLPPWATFSITPPPSVSNVGSGLEITAYQGTRLLGIDNGTPVPVTTAQLEFICDFANLWHTALKNTPQNSVDYRSFGRDPLYTFLPSSFHKELTTLGAVTFAPKVTLKPTQFWKLRYLFIPISFIPDPVKTPYQAHVAFCAISPEAKTIDFLCSGGDDGMPLFGKINNGAKCLPDILHFLAEFLDLTDEPSIAVCQPFIPAEWTLRKDGSNKQELDSGHCGVYVVTQAMCLAFGWGINVHREGGAFHNDHQKKMEVRRHRCVQDLWLRGFHGWKDLDPTNLQYYPLVDRIPEPATSFKKINKDILRHCPRWMERRRSCYGGARTKAQLAKHCQRNARFYPGYLRWAMKDDVSFRAFRDWIEERDWMWLNPTGFKEKDLPKKYEAGVSEPHTWRMPSDDFWK